MKTNNKVTTLCIIASAVLIACGNQTAATPLVDSSSTATFIPVLISTHLYTVTAISASTPSITPSIEINSSEFCIAAIAPWSCSCGDLSNELIQIRNASQVGLCDVTLRLEEHEAGGYNVMLPNNWFCKVVGVASNNLRCFSGDNQEIFLQSLVTELPVTQADEAISVFQEGEGHFSDPIVETDEKKISRELVTIGDKQVLKLLTSQKDSFILRYFVKSEGSLYVLTFEMKDPDDQENRKTIIILEDAIHSMRFFQ
jgi:hypothetical protein